jgi:DNA-binding response OmpR family regulator
MKRKILVIEDDEAIINIIRRCLVNAGFSVVFSMTGMGGLKKVRELNLDLIILDFELPDTNGFDLCRILNQNRETCTIPKIIMTGKVIEESDAVEGLDLGAADFIRKPFGLKEFVSRVNAVLRRSSHEDGVDEVYEAGNIRINVDRREVHAGSRKVHLSPKEFDLLNVFMKNINKVLTNEQLLNAVWDYDSGTVTTYTLTVHINRLRSKLGTSAAKKIVTQHTVGYKFQP